MRPSRSIDPIEAWDAAVVSGHEMKMLVTELRRLTGGMPELGVALPDHRDVFATLVGEEGDVVNTLFYGDNCNMAYGDARAVLIKMIEGVRGLGLAAAA